MLSYERDKSVRFQPHRCGAVKRVHADLAAAERAVDDELHLFCGVVHVTERRDGARLQAQELAELLGRGKRQLARAHLVLRGAQGHRLGLFHGEDIVVELLVVTHKEVLCDFVAAFEPERNDIFNGVGAPVFGKAVFHALRIEHGKTSCYLIVHKTLFVHLSPSPRRRCRKMETRFVLSHYPFFIEIHS